MQTAITGAGIKRDVREIELLDQVDDDVRLPTFGRFFDVRICHEAILLKLRRAKPVRAISYDLPCYLGNRSVARAPREIAPRFNGQRSMSHSGSDLELLNP